MGEELMQLGYGFSKPVLLVIQNVTQSGIALSSMIEDASFNRNAEIQAKYDSDAVTYFTCELSMHKEFG